MIPKWTEWKLQLNWTPTVIFQDRERFLVAVISRMDMWTKFVKDMYATDGFNSETCSVARCYQPLPTLSLSNPSITSFQLLPLPMRVLQLFDTCLYSRYSQFRKLTQRTAYPVHCGCHSWHSVLSCNTILESMQQPSHYSLKSISGYSCRTF